MSTPPPPEAWLRGPLPEIPGLLQPVAHALLQAREELERLLKDFPDAFLWERPAGMASVGFHLQHLTGVLDRLFTYARGEVLSQDQLEALTGEGKPIGADGVSLRGEEKPEEGGDVNTAEAFVKRFHRQVEAALEQLKSSSERELLDTRWVGRARIPSTQLGLLVHAAEHTMRHLGQLLVTVRIVKG